jgi:hypothetical protein
LGSPLRFAEQSDRSGVVQRGGGQNRGAHGFIKKTQKTPSADLALARKRKREFET